ncbi:MAG: pyruvate synthase [Firmicutes bacterium]|nr:pyruvate synthase [Bacillota bacterium]
MEGLVEIRWHARGGQGAKTAAILLAEAAEAAGQYIQGFPEYGPERMGAPILAFNRLSNKPIRVHGRVESPDIVVVLDPTLIGKVNIGEGFPPHGVLLVNTPKSPSEVRAKVGVQGGKVYTVDASRIAMEELGKDIPNTPMMGAVMAIAKLLDFDKFIEVTRAQMEHKFRGNTKVVEGNIKAIERARQEVKAE